ncbi:hypothetical protein [Leptothoe spongobia]|uniref:Uncharacterized protein n=1 Tax=Leptothoe spongobia TAU-MAC 1115 TaxID=1967444 RepID=A0A947DJ65_9CYAN|nr:hypothetical protein [Leptothoe spongobia]MBT9317990.1 hypothetical protein [Leptothoe spongobia TAU-MAC 1115]
MDPAIIAAIIGGVFTVVGPIATVIVTRYINNREKLTIYSNRRALMTGQWKGTTQQDEGIYANIPIPMLLTAKANRKTIAGEFRLQFPQSANVTDHDAAYSFQGCFLYGNFLQLNYRSKNKRRVEFGVAVLELDPSGETLAGKYAGYGASSKHVVTGHFDIRRTS